MECILYLTSLTKHNYFENHTYCCFYQKFMLFSAEQYFILQIYTVYLSTILCWWTFELFPFFYYYKQSFNAYPCTYALLSFVLNKCLEMEWLSHMACMFSFLRNSNCLPKWLNHFTFLPAVCESSSCFTSSSTLDMVSDFNFRHSNKWVVVCHCGFNLHFLHDQWC